MTRRKLRIGFVSIVVALLLVILSTLSVSAQATSYRGVSQAASDPVTVVEILLRHGHAEFSRKTIAVKVGVPFQFSNHTTATQTLTINGTPAFNVPKNGDLNLVCNSPNTATFGLVSNKTAKMVVTCT